MLVAITGSSGSIGTALVARALEDGHSVRGIDKASPTAKVEAGHFDFVQADLVTYATCLDALRGCEAVIHSAAIPSPGGVPDHVVHNLNTTLSYNILRACAELGINRVCQLSSVNAPGAAYTPYKINLDYLPIDENTRMQPADPYALSKLICEAQADSIARTYPTMRIASIRTHHNLDEAMVVSDDIKSKSVEEAWGSMPACNDCWGWVSKDATARACLAALTTEGWTGHGVFYIVAPTTKADGDPRASSVELARRFHGAAKVREGWFEQAEYRGFFDTGKAERILGWKHDL